MRRIARGVNRTLGKGDDRQIQPVEIRDVEVRHVERNLV